MAIMDILDDDSLFSINDDNYGDVYGDSDDSYHDGDDLDAYNDGSQHDIDGVLVSEVYPDIAEYDDQDQFSADDVGQEYDDQYSEDEYDQTYEDGQDSADESSSDPIEDLGADPSDTEQPDIPINSELTAESAPPIDDPQTQDDPRADESPKAISATEMESMKEVVDKKGIDALAEEQQKTYLANLEHALDLRERIDELESRKSRYEDVLNDHADDSDELFDDLIAEGKQITKDLVIIGGIQTIADKFSGLGEAVSLAIDIGDHIGAELGFNDRDLTDSDTSILKRGANAWNITDNLERKKEAYEDFNERVRDNLETRLSETRDDISKARVVSDDDRRLAEQLRQMYPDVEAAKSNRSQLSNYDYGIVDVDDMSKANTIEVAIDIFDMFDMFELKPIILNSIHR